MLKASLIHLLILLSGLACAQSSPAPEPQAPAPSAESTSSDLRNLLVQKGLSENFIRLLETRYTRNKNWLSESLKIIEPNVFGFLYQGNYMNHDSPLARKKTARYIRAHHNSFEAARSRFQVSPESIAALLWVETKLGNLMGTHSIPFVFYSIALSGQPSVCSEMAKRTETKLAAIPSTEKPDLETAQKKREERCKQKSEWAIEELKVLERLHLSGKLNAFQLRGSFAGAFGIPQFLPSSYEKYAVSNYRKKPDLFLISDAILSVGNFLSKNGWKQDSPDSQAQALFSYNRSKDYGIVIRQIAGQLGEI